MSTPELEKLRRSASKLKSFNVLASDQITRIADMLALFNKVSPEDALYVLLIDSIAETVERASDFVSEKQVETVLERLAENLLEEITNDRQENNPDAD